MPAPRPAFPAAQVECSRDRLQSSPEAQSRHGAPTLTPLVGKDLRQLPPDHLKQLLSLLCPIEEHLAFAGSPWYVWPLHTPQETRYVVFFGSPLHHIPGSAESCIFLFDDTERLIGKWTFSTGWRITILDAQLRHIDEIDSDVVVIESGPLINGADIARQYFAFSGCNLRFIRAEDSNHRQIDNWYSAANHTIGIPPFEETEDQWTKLLGSPSAPDVLSGLLFLGGSHASPDRLGDGIAIELPGQARVAAKMLKSPKIRELVDSHLKSSIAWVREAAAQAVSKREP